MKQISCSKVLILVLSLLLSLASSLAAPTIQEKLVRCLNSYSYKFLYPISNAIYTPSNPSFSSVLKAYERNFRFHPHQSPTIVAVITALEDCHVQATVKCCRKLDLLIKTRSGGHDYEGLSYRSELPFVVLDMFNLRSIDIDLEKDTMWVQSGATLGEIYYNIANKSKVWAFPSGVCPTVGVGGHFSGGGYGNLMRKHGLSVDNIIDARLVNAHGKILHRKSMGEDLFWAIRGGGGASFGVILAWKVRLVAIPETITYFYVDRTLEQGATDLVYKWQQVATMLPDELFIRLEIKVIDVTGENYTGGKTVNVAFISSFLGKPDPLLHIMSSSFPELGLTETDCQEMPWVNTTLLWAKFPNGTSLETLLSRDGGSPFKYKSDIIRDIIPKDGLEQIWKNMIDRRQEVTMQWNPYGGKVSSISVSATPYPHRDALAKIEYLHTWAGQENDAARRKYMASSREFHRFMTPYVSKHPREAFLNYRDLDIGCSSLCNATYKEAEVYGRKYFNGNFDRLVRVKTAFDPENFFRNEQSVPPGEVDVTAH